MQKRVSREEDWRAGGEKPTYEVVGYLGACRWVGKLQRAGRCLIRLPIAFLDYTYYVGDLRNPVTNRIYEFGFDPVRALAYNGDGVIARVCIVVEEHHDLIHLALCPSTLRLWKRNMFCHEVIEPLAR